MSKQKKHDSEQPLNESGVTPEPGSTEAPASATPGTPGATQPEAEASASTPGASAQAERIAGLEAEVSSLKDQYLRKLADYENFRKRMFREKEDAVKYANAQILSDLVTVLDDFDRAVKSVELSKDFQSLHDGVEMIRKTLLGTLASKHGLEAMDASGKPFDPNMHEAVMSEQGECAEPLVVEEFVKGYRLRDRVLRSAKVKVRMPLPGGANDNETLNEAKA